MITRSPVASWGVTSRGDQLAALGDRHHQAARRQDDVLEPRARGRATPAPTVISTIAYPLSGLLGM